MHSITFALKRAHLSTTNDHERELREIVPGMTLARFDLMCFTRQVGIKRGVAKPNVTTQRRIIAALGLHPSTISKMLKRLAEMGWIERDHEYGNRRIKTVELTTLGLQKIWKAMRVVFRNRELATYYEQLARQLRPDVHVLRALDYLVGTIEAIAHAFGNHSVFFYDHGSHHERLPYWAYKWKTPVRRSPPRVSRESRTPQYRPAPTESEIALERAKKQNEQNERIEPNGAAETEAAEEMTAGAKLYEEEVMSRIRKMDPFGML